MWVFFLILLIIVISFLLLFPFKFIVWNESEYLYVKISKIITIKINMLILFDNNHNEEIKKQARFIKLINKVRIESVDLKVSGLNLDYEYSGVLFGYLNILLAALRNYLMMKNSELTYDLKYIGERSVKFKGIFYSKLGTILKQVFGGKKSERASN